MFSTSVFLQMTTPFGIDKRRNVLKPDLRPVHTSAICQSVDKRQKTERLTETWTDSQKQIIICSVFSVGQIGHICWHLWRQMPFCSVHSVGQNELKNFQLFSVDRSMWVVFFLKMMRAFLKILVKFGNDIMYLWNWELSRKIYLKKLFLNQRNWNF